MRILAALMMAALASLAATALAQTSPVRRIVVVVPSNVEASRQDTALAAIRGQLGDLPLEVVVEQPAEQVADLRERLDLAAKAAKTHGALGAFVLELDRADDLLVYLVEPEARRALVRRVTASSSETAGFEELSLIVRSTSSALLEGRAIGMEEGPALAPEPAPPPPTPVVVDRPPPPPPKPQPGRTERATSTGRLAAFYVGEDYAPEAGWQNGLGLRVSVSLDGRLFAGLGYFVFPPIDVDTGEAAARVTRYPGELFVGYEVPIERVRIGVELGARAEVATRTTLRTGAGIDATPDDTRLLWGVAGRAGVRWVLTERVQIGAALGVEVFVNDSDYVVDLAGEREPVLRPRTLRPRAEAGLLVNLW